MIPGSPGESTTRKTLNFSKLTFKAFLNGQWSRCNNVKLHEQKFELLNHFHNSKAPLSELPFHTETLFYKVSGEVTLHPVENVRDLGVKVSSDMRWSKHVGEMVAKARSKLSWVLSVFKTQDRVVMITLYKSLVRNLLGPS